MYIYVGTKQSINFNVWGHCYLKYTHRASPFYPEEFCTAAEVILSELHTSQQDITISTIYLHLCSKFNEGLQHCINIIMAVCYAQVGSNLCRVAVDEVEDGYHGGFVNNPHTFCMISGAVAMQAKPFSCEIFLYKYTQGSRYLLVCF